VWFKLLCIVFLRSIKLILNKMPAGRLLSEGEKGRIKAYNDAGFNVSEISRKIGRTRCVITNFLRNPEEYGVKRSSGRKPKLDDRDKRRIILEASNSFASCSTIALSLCPG